MTIFSTSSFPIEHKGLLDKEMTSFVDLSLERAYRSSTHRLGQDFYARLLSQATGYQRAAGYFSSAVFGVAPDAHLKYFRRGGQIKIVSSDVLGSTDIVALTNSVFDRPQVRNRWKLESIEPQDLGSRIPWVDWLSWLVASDLIELRIALLTDRQTVSLYHEKIGIFHDAHGNIVAFSGSANETDAAYSTNFERVDVFASFEPDAERRRALAIESQFNQLWRNATPGLLVLKLHEALERGVLQSRPDSGEPDRIARPGQAATRATAPEALHPPGGLKLFSHQAAAIEAWARAGGKGLFEMATGSGKTITALALASRLYDRIGRGFVLLIVAPLIHLVDQWIEVASGFGLRPIRCAEGAASWYAELNAGIQASNSLHRPILSIVTTAATLAGEPLQRLLADIRRPMLLVADEVHTYGSEANFESLPKADVYRLGLSATPERWFDPDGTARILRYFGGVVFRYSLADALRDDVLTPYRYYPETVELAAEEFDQYLHLTRQLSRFTGQDDGGPMNAIAQRLLIKRARVVASARSKLPRLRSLMGGRSKDRHLLVYCGDGTVEGPEPDETHRQVQAAVKMIGSELGMTCASYTAETPPPRRRDLLRDFSNGDLQVLVAIRCLDEGVDVPATRSAYVLASSTNPRQFVQRRGRVLRRFPGKSRADIFDFFVVPPGEDYGRDSTEFKCVRGLLRTQLARVREFADLAENGPVAREVLLRLRSRFDLLAEG